jgi:hypothetical protein
VHLEADEALGMRPVNVLVGQVLDRLAVDPGPDARPLRDDAIAVPLPVPKVRVRHAARRRRQPAASRRLAVDIAGQARARLDLDLWPEHPPGAVVRAFARAPLPGPRADLDARVQRVVDPDLELELEIAVGLLGRQKRVRAALARAPDDRPILNPILRRAVPLHPAVQRPAVEQRDPTLAGTAGTEERDQRQQHTRTENHPAHRPPLQ